MSEVAFVSTSSLWNQNEDKAESSAEPKPEHYAHLMDPFSIIGGLAAVTQLCGTALTVANVAHRFARNAGGASAEVKRFADQVRIFADGVRIAELSLRNYCTDTKNQESPLVLFVCSRHLLDLIGDEAKVVQQRLRIIRDQIKGLGSSSILWAAIKWTWKRPSILGLVPEMESIKSSLNLMVVSSMLDELVCAGRRNSDEL